MRKQLAVLMGAALLVAGASGTAFPVKSAYAAEIGTTTTSVEGSAGTTADTQSGASTAGAAVSYNTLLLNNWLGKLDIHTQAAAGTNSEDFQNALASGATLTTASKLNPSDLIDKLKTMFAEDMAGEVQSGNLSAPEAAALEETAYPRIADLVSSGWSTDSQTAVIQTNGAAIIHSHLSTIADDASLPSGIGTIELRKALRSGKSLVDASGMDASALSDALTALLNQDLEAAVKNGTLPSDQLEKAEKDGASALWDAANTPGYDSATTPWMEQYGQRLLADVLDPSSIVQKAATIAGKDIDDVHSALLAGQSLSTIAGMSEADLTSQLTADVNDALEHEWEAGNLSVQLLTKLEQNSADALQKAVDQNGLGTQTAAGTSNPALAAESIRSVVENIADYAGVAVSDLRGKLADGQPLVNATSVDPAELTSMLQSRVDTFLDTAVQNGWLTQEDEQPTKTEAYGLLNAAITNSNYKATMDTKQYLTDRLNRIVDDAADVMETKSADSADATQTKSDDLLKIMASGKSLQQAVGIDADSLLIKLLRHTNEEINGFVADGSLSEQDAAKLKQDYASAVTKLLSNN
ncbi:hypothetical protein BC351_23785 [Paenibacillus ferrarius]|uniref:Copper amine oxidase-like N-terminal domain-containing protein n=1 Tax=Paenibacillus ferrarius TaxID=1469647 RepID=A0A1V4HM72_9BACL|nr:hypothetical protein [Paenibacillus ferrarius]OPH58378.1 hypothetical protein BC351_23785 [Paenibacillus ferrarius]